MHLHLSHAAALLALLIASLAAPMSLAQPFAPATAPAADMKPHDISGPAGVRVDEYYWMRDDDPKAKRPEIIEHLKAENAYTEAVMAPLEPLRKALVTEMRARIKEDDSSVPVYDNAYWYSRRFQTGAEYPQYLRQRGTPAAPDTAAPVEVMLDGPVLAQGQPYFSVGAYAASPDNRLLAWTENNTGKRSYTLRFKNLATGEVLPDAIPGVLEAIVWAADGRSLFYIRQDPQLLQSGPVYRHVLGTDPARDTKVFEEPDQTIFTHIERSASRQYLLIGVTGYDITEWLALPLAQPEAAPRVVLPRKAGVRSYLDHLRGQWVIRTNEGARNFRLVSAPEAAPADRVQWREIVPGRAQEALDGFALFDSAIVVEERVEANARLRVLPWPGAAGRDFVVPASEEAYAMALGANPDPASPRVRYAYSSMVTPATTIDADLATGERTVRKVQPVLGYDPALYASARVWAPARDGKRIPVSLAWRKDRARQDGTAPLLQVGYGAYGYAYDPGLSSNAVSLLDRGFVLAIAHVRGGSELGQDWYEDGRLMNKRNTFNDFVDVTDFLVRERWAAPDKVFASGGSAGGLLMGAVANQAGAKYRGIGLHVPFVDAVTTMLDPTIPLTVNEWTQWGDPRERPAYDYILAYSPYDQLARRDYPAMLVTTGLWDSMVQYFEPAKYVARLRRLKTDANPLLFHVNLEAGHGGASGRFEYLNEVAREYAFFLGLLGQTR
jgi:oligopeptidase B